MGASEDFPDGSLGHRYLSVMGIFDDLKKRVSDKLAERASEVAAEQSKAAAKAFAKKTVDQAKGFGKKLEEGLFGPSPAETETEGEEGDERRASEAGDKLRAGAKANEERTARERREAEERAEKAARVEREVDAELAALKSRLKK